MAARFLLPVLAALLVSCASKPAWQEDGLASYVADHYTGRPTSSGELYHPQAYTAAHYSLPFGTVVTVKNLQTGRDVNVTVNDRFPYYPGRVINLSSIAAQHIGIPYMGMAQVRVTARSVPPGMAQAGHRAGYGHARATAPSYQQQPPPAAYTSPAAYPQRSGGIPAYPAAPAPAYPAGVPAYPQPAAAPAPQAPAQPPAQRSWWRNPFSSGRTPSAPQYQGGSAPPPGLQTF